MANIRKQPWDNLITTVNKAKVKAKLHRNTYLDQKCFKGKYPLKISINSRGQPERAQKTGAISQSKNKPNQAK